MVLQFVDGIPLGGGFKIWKWIHYIFLVFFDRVSESDYSILLRMMVLIFDVPLMVRHLFDLFWESRWHELFYHISFEVWRYIVWYWMVITESICIFSHSLWGMLLFMVMRQKRGRNRKSGRTLVLRWYYTMKLCSIFIFIPPFCVLSCNLK